MNNVLLDVFVHLIFSANIFLPTEQYAPTFMQIILYQLNDVPCYTCIKWTIVAISTWL